MNRPDKAGEPSMEEILASIRQIIADEPPAEANQPAIEANPLVPQSAGGAANGAGGSQAAAPPASMPPLVDRLSGVLKSRSLPPTSPLGSKRPLSFDQDLADMFDEHQAGGGVEQTPKPGLRVSPELSASPASPVNGAAKSELDGAAALPPQLAVPTPSVPPPPFGSVSAPVEPPAPRPFGFPPLRKASFYPPEDKQPVLPPITGAPAQAADAKGAPADGAGKADGSGSVEDALRRLSGFGAVVPGEIASGGAASPASPFGAPSRTAAASEAPADVPRAPELSLSVDPLARTSAAPGAASVSALPVPPSTLSSPAALSSPVAPPDRLSFPELPAAAARSESALVFGTPEPQPAISPAAPFAGSPAPDKPLDGPAPVSAFGADGLPAAGAAAPRPVPDPDPSVVAAQALDALAQGLAASAAASAVSAATAQPAVALTPVADLPDAAVVRDQAPQSLPAPAGAAGGVRTLEDAVADMLRPMLQQWVADNMPRIIERALRVEVGKMIKPGSGPNSSGS